LGSLSFGFFGVAFVFYTMFWADIYYQFLNSLTVHRVGVRVLTGTLIFVLVFAVSNSICAVTSLKGFGPEYQLETFRSGC